MTTPLAKVCGPLGPRDYARAFARGLGFFAAATFVVASAMVLVDQAPAARTIAIMGFVDGPIALALWFAASRLPSGAAR